MDTTKSLLHTFTLPKPQNPKDGSTTSKPNHAKVDVISTGVVVSILGANCGHASLLSICLEATRRAVSLILAHAPEGMFATAHDTIVNQLTVLLADVKQLSEQGAKAEADAWQADLKAKSQAPKGAISDEQVANKAGKISGAPVNLTPTTAIPVDSLPTDKAELEKVLTNMLANLKDDDTGSAN